MAEVRVSPAPVDLSAIKSQNQVRSDLGSPYHLPAPISLTNSFYLRTYPNTPPTTLIVVGWSQEEVDTDFAGCRLAGHLGNSFSAKNEESEDHPDIFVCGAPRHGGPEFWKTHERYG